jgi:hypothetical protein
VPVVGDVHRIIEINEIAVRDLPEGHEGGDDEEQADYEQALLCRYNMADRGCTMRTFVGDRFMTIGAQVDAGFFCRRYLSCRCFLSVLFSGRVFWCSLSFVLHGSLRPAFFGIEACSLGFTFLAFLSIRTALFHVKRITAASRQVAGLKRSSWLSQRSRRKGIHPRPSSRRLRQRLSIWKRIPVLLPPVAVLLSSLTSGFHPVAIDYNSRYHSAPIGTEPGLSILINLEPYPLVGFATGRSHEAAQK